jgi:hypothetical protein
MEEEEFEDEDDFVEDEIEEASSEPEEIKKIKQQINEQTFAPDVGATSMFDEVAAAVLADLNREPRENRKPDISALDEGLVVVDDSMILPVFSNGDKIVIERYNSVLNGKPWLDTRTYIVENIDDETGDMKLWDPERNHWSLWNYISGTAKGDVVKLAPAKNVIGAKRRGRPRKHILPETKEVHDGPKRRGRPPGSKNRPREEILKDRLERELRRELKRG